MLISDIKLNSSYSSLLNRLDRGAYDLLKEDIRQHGLQTPLIINQHNELIDGHNRRQALLDLGETVVPAKQISFDDDLSAIEYMASLQSGRRNLSPNERLKLIPILLTQLKVKYGEGQLFSYENNSICTNDRIAKVLNVSKATVARDIAKLKQQDESIVSIGKDPGLLSQQERQEALKLAEEKEANALRKKLDTGNTDLSKKSLAQLKRYEQEQKEISQLTQIGTERIGDTGKEAGMTELFQADAEKKAEQERKDRKPLEPIFTKEHKQMRSLQQISKGCAGLKSLDIATDTKIALTLDTVLAELLTISDKEHIIDSVLNKLESIGETN